MTTRQIGDYDTFIDSPPCLSYSTDSLVDNSKLKHISNKSEHDPQLARKSSTRQDRPHHHHRHDNPYFQPIVDQSPKQNQDITAVNISTIPRRSKKQQRQSQLDKDAQDKYRMAAIRDSKKRTNLTRTHSHSYGATSAKQPQIQTKAHHSKSPPFERPQSIPIPVLQNERPEQSQQVFDQKPLQPLPEFSQGPIKYPDLSSGYANIGKEKSHTSSQQSSKPDQSPWLMKALGSVVENGKKMFTTSQTPNIQNDRVKTSQPSHVQTDHIKTSQPPIIQPTPFALQQSTNVQPESFIPPQLSDIQPEPFRPPQFANIQTEAFRPPQSANIQPEVSRPPQSATIQPEPFRLPQSAISQPEPFMLPQPANIQPESAIPFHGINFQNKSALPQIARIESEPIMFSHATHMQTEPTMRRSGTNIRRKPVTPSMGLSDNISPQSSTIGDNFVTTNPDRFSNAMVRQPVQLPMQSNFYQYTPPSEYPPNPYTVGSAPRNPGYTEDPALDMPSPGKVGYGPEQTHDEIPDIDIGSPSSVNSPVAVTPIVSEPPSASLKYFNFEAAQGLVVPAVVLVLSVVFLATSSASESSNNVIQQMAGVFNNILRSGSIITMSGSSLYLLYKYLSFTKPASKVVASSPLPPTNPEKEIYFAGQSLVNDPFYWQTIQEAQEIARNELEKLNKNRTNPQHYRIPASNNTEVSRVPYTEMYRPQQTLQQNMAPQPVIPYYRPPNNKYVPTSQPYYDNLHIPYANAMYNPSYSLQYNKNIGEEYQHKNDNNYTEQPRPVAMRRTLSLPPLRKVKASSQPGMASPIFNRFFSQLSTIGSVSRASSIDSVKPTAGAKFNPTNPVRRNSTVSEVTEVSPEISTFEKPFSERDFSNTETETSAESEEESESVYLPFQDLNFPSQEYKNPRFRTNPGLGFDFGPKPRSKFPQSIVV